MTQSGPCGRKQRAALRPARALLLCPLLFATLVCAATARTVDGGHNKPFPIIGELGFEWSRAEAWLAALRKAEAYLPTAAGEGLRQLGLEPGNAALALCAMLFPVASTSPPRAPERDVRVRLQIGEVPDFGALIRNPATLLEKMAMLVRMRTILARLATAWPRKVAEAPAKIPTLEKLGNLLDIYWRLLTFPPSGNNAAFLEEAATLLEDDAAVWLILARARLAANEPGLGIAAADKALAISLEKRASARKNFTLWNLLTAEIYFCRGNAHWRLAQPGLAAADFKACLAILEENAVKIGLAARAALALGNLARERHDYEPMCAYFALACARGECGALAAEKRIGNCATEAEAQQ